MKVLVLVNDPPYGTERCYNALRLAGSLAKREQHEVRVFLMGDAVSGAKSGQTVPQGFYSMERMLQVVLQHRGSVGLCATCMDARGMRDDELVAGTRRSSLKELTDWTEWADQSLVF